MAIVVGFFVGNQYLRTSTRGSRLRGIVVAGSRIYLALALIQFMLGMLLGGGLVLLGYDVADAEALLRGLE